MFSPPPFPPDPKADLHQLRCSPSTAVHVLPSFPPDPRRVGAIKALDFDACDAAKPLRTSSEGSLGAIHQASHAVRSVGPDGPGPVVVLFIGAANLIWWSRFTSLESRMNH